MTARHWMHDRHGVVLPGEVVVWLVNVQGPLNDCFRWRKHNFKPCWQEEVEQHVPPSVQPSCARFPLTSPLSPGREEEKNTEMRKKSKIRVAHGHYNTTNLFTWTYQPRYSVFLSQQISQQYFLIWLFSEANK